ncbi:uncharacterized protein SPPG_09214 [Spizellomyces punctatus DAOM BR117]|uniref:C2H2-type domain-containing protein n=1 Tax=Spizellomyces punctatus (strain DAOM BR117) TaxID=645134 RepID=A0A0L0HFR8_SPIPD|nr:uncharacterized protein SPPG_09214 [Spizellomyces punctatus DAOM BR117]KND00331.1 hypothetical protein SPPG_09214 [Spizellomyces punctatus DAOM BR117]|eukprot:XP_016608370.1 hypothetical protein SPPG_09214 [Spizellomyces punctatus DAOM BR117]
MKHVDTECPHYVVHCAYHPPPREDNSVIGTSLCLRIGRCPKPPLRRQMQEHCKPHVTDPPTMFALSNAVNALYPFDCKTCYTLFPDSDLLRTHNCALPNTVVSPTVINLATYQTNLRYDSCAGYLVPYSTIYSIVCPGCGETVENGPGDLKGHRESCTVNRRWIGIERS